MIRDTEDETEGKEGVDNPAVKEPNPILSEQNVKIGDFYYKKKNYTAAIRRYLEAIEYQPGSARAHDALARAYEKNGESDKAIALYKQFIDKNPNTKESAAFRKRLAKLATER